MGQDSSQLEFDGTDEVANGVAIEPDTEHEKHFEVEERGTDEKGLVQSERRKPKKREWTSRIKEKKSKRRKSVQNTTSADRWTSSVAPDSLLSKSHSRTRKSPAASGFRPVNADHSYNATPVKVERLRVQNNYARDYDNHQAMVAKEVLRPRLGESASADNDPLDRTTGIETVEAGVDERKITHLADVQLKEQVIVDADVKPKHKSFRIVRPRQTQTKPAKYREDLDGEDQVIEKKWEELDSIAANITAAEVTEPNITRAEVEEASQMPHAGNEGATALLEDKISGQARNTSPPKEYDLLGSSDISRSGQTATESFPAIKVSEDAVSHDQNLARPTAAALANSLSGKATLSDQHTEDPVVTMIGIYKSVNCKLQRRETPLSSGEEDASSFAVVDFKTDLAAESPKVFRKNSEVFGVTDIQSTQAAEPSKGVRRKRRAPTDNESVFDLEIVMDQPKRKKIKRLEPKASLPSTLKTSRSLSSKTMKAKSTLSDTPSSLKSRRPAPVFSSPLFADATVIDDPFTTPEPAAPGPPNNAYAKAPYAKHTSAEPMPAKASPNKPVKNGGHRERKAAKDPVVQGKFSEDEIALIANEMVKYREARNDMPEVELNQLVQDNATTGADLWNQLCDILPDRSRQSIIKICRRRYHNYSARGRWTEEEDRELKEAYDSYPKGWKKIGELLNRHHEDVRDRWRNYLICGDNLRKNVWTEDEEEALRLAIVECLEVIKELKEKNALKWGSVNEHPKTDMELIDWQIVSVKLNHTRSRLQCMTKWNQMRERENADNGEAVDLKIGDRSHRVLAAKKSYLDMGLDDKLELLHCIRQSQAGREGKVPFKTLGDIEFRQKWPCMARKFAWKKLRATVPGNGEMKLQDIVTILIEELREHRNYPTRNDNVSNEDLKLAKRSKGVPSTGAFKLSQSEALLSSDSEQEDEQQNVQDGGSDEHRTIRKEKKDRSVSARKASQSLSPVLTDYDDDHGILLKGIQSTIEKKSAEDDAVIPESDSSSILESPARKHNQQRSSIRGRYDHHYDLPQQPFQKEKKLKKIPVAPESLDDGDIPAQQQALRSWSESVEL